MDVIVALIAAAAACALVAIPFAAPALAASYRDFAAELPWATELALAPWASPSIAVGVIAGAAFALLRTDVVHRRLLLAASALGGCVSVAAFWYALYLPLFELSGAIAE